MAKAVIIQVFFQGTGLGIRVDQAFWFVFSVLYIKNMSVLELRQCPKVGKCLFIQNSPTREMVAPFGCSPTGKNLPFLVPGQQLKVVGCTTQRALVAPPPPSTEQGLTCHRSTLLGAFILWSTQNYPKKKSKRLIEV